MFHSRYSGILLLVICATFMSPNLAQAKRFKRYPDDTGEQANAADPTPPRPSEHPDGEPPAFEYADEPIARESDTLEEAPGLLGYPLHGRGGLTVEYIYTGDVFANIRGGVNTNDATEYLGLFDLALSADLDDMGLSPGGTVFVLFEQLHGRGITDRHVGDFQAVDNMDPGKELTQVSEFWWERSVLDGRIAVRLGKQDANAEFGVVDLGGDFINSSFGMQPNVIMPAWPDQAMGVVTFFEITESTSFKVGVFDGAATGGTWGFSGTGDVSSLYELKSEWSLMDGQLPGDFHVGMWYHNGQFDDVSGSGPTHSGNHGVYLGMDQLICRESWDVDDDQGLGAFVHYGWAPEARNEVPNYIGGGLVYKGLIPCRDDDFTGIGVAHAMFADGLVGQSAETAIEVFYKAQVSPHIVVQPDLQFISQPSGMERNAAVFGLRFELVL